MDFDDLDEAEEVIEPELLSIVEELNTPGSFKDYLRDRGLTSCLKFYDSIKSTEQSAINSELEKVGVSLSPPAQTTKEQLAIRNVWRRCRDMAEQEREALEKLRAEEAAAEKRRQAEEKAREKEEKDRQRREAEEKAKEAREAERQRREAERKAKEDAERQEREAKYEAELQAREAAREAERKEREAKEEAERREREAKEEAERREREAKEEAERREREAKEEAERQAREGAEASVRQDERWAEEELQRREEVRQQREVEAANYPPEWEGLRPPPARGVFVPHTTGRPKVGEWRPQLAQLAPNLRKITPFDEHLKAKPQKVFDEEMEKLKDEGPIGHFYGLRFPYTYEMIKRYGKEFLTKALHKAGTMPKDNYITKMETETFVGGSMALKCFIYLEYAKPDENLHTKLFMKYPFPASNGHERKTVYISRFLLNNDGPELDFARILSAGAPMRCPKYYFGDICLKTGTCIFITEKLNLPPPDANFGPYEFEPVPYKSVDYLLDEPLRYYDSMTRNIATLAAWGKSGKFGKDIMEIFPPPQHPAAYFMGTKKRVEMFLWFLGENATMLVPPEVRDAEFARSMYELLPEVERCQKEILDYLFDNSDYCGFTHQNMNTDNAIFWRDEHGELESGFIDWGRFKQDNIARGLSNGYMCTDLAEFLQEHDKTLLRNYMAQYICEGGPCIEFDTFWEHYMLSWLLLGLSAVDLPRQIFMCGSKHVVPEAWPFIHDYKDPRVFHMPNYNNGMVAIVRNFAYYWKVKDLPGFWNRWKKAHLPKKFK